MFYYSGGQKICWRYGWDLKLGWNPSLKAPCPGPPTGWMPCPAMTYWDPTTSSCQSTGTDTGTGTGTDTDTDVETNYGTVCVNRTVIREVPVEVEKIVYVNRTELKER